MSSAPARISPIPGRVVRGVVWLLLFTVLAAGGAGLISQTWHAPGTPARAELTFAGDRALQARLDAATVRLRAIAADADRLAGEAKRALSEVSSFDPARLEASLARGDALAATIDQAARALRDSLNGLPGDGANASLEYSNPTLVRRAAVLAASDAASSIGGQWRTVTARAGDAANLIARISEHDQTVVEALQQGVARRYLDAATILDTAILTVASIQELRKQLIASAQPTVLDEWIDRSRAYDVALQALYAALDDSKGKITIEVQAARREERLAYENLPPDRRTIIVIVAEVARGGLTQAVLAIEDAGGHIEAALAETGAAPTVAP
ncbi:MAG TPA: hypothetical protein VM451_08640 [Candidatus Limnocylindria bacterium]|nr:hypothetical protein [Candidatus Limnocylindria bacterium]